MENLSVTLIIFFFHQANKYILKTIATRLKIPPDKVPDTTISLYGNQSSASIPCVINMTLTAGDNKLSVLSGFVRDFLGGAYYAT